MVKNNIFRTILFFLALASYSICYAQIRYGGESLSAKSASVSNPIITDTGGRERDSLTKAIPFVADPKQGFKDLFVGSSAAGALNTSQLNPRAINFVQDYMETHQKGLEKMKGWGKPYFDMMARILESHGVPGEMKYLSVIESYLKSSAVSWVGAVGPWQFMPGTGRQNGLRVDRYVDERTDYYKSTHAAAHYLTMLFNTYRDWLLVIAAYNGGPGKVDAAIRKSGSRDFWVLQNYLPAESRNHVKKFIATHYIMEGQGGITTLTKDEAINLKLNYAQNQSKFLASRTDSTKSEFISGRYNSSVIAQFTTMDINLFNQYNPDFDNQIIEAGSYELKLPSAKMDLFQSNKVKILYESMQQMLNAVNETRKAF